MELTYSYKYIKNNIYDVEQFSQNTYWKLVENLIPARLSERSLWDQHIWFWPCCHISEPEMYTYWYALKCRNLGFSGQACGEYSVWLHRGSPKCLQYGLGCNWECVQDWVWACLKLCSTSSQHPFVPLGNGLLHEPSWVGLFFTAADFELYEVPSVHKPIE